MHIQPKLTGIIVDAGHRARLYASYAKECPDEISSLSEIHKNYLALEKNDTVFFKDRLRHKIYYLTCKNKNIDWKGIYHDDYHCENGGYNERWETIKIDLFSNIPFFDNTFTKIAIQLDTWDSFEIVFESLDEMTLKETGENIYPYHLKFNDTENKLYISGNSSHSSIHYIDSLIINEIIYSNIAIITNDLGNFYDTIYYNDNGFLKFVSSDHKYNLEIME